jgi:hypothetical protein
MKHRPTAWNRNNKNKNPCKPGLAIKNPPNETQKNPPKNPHLKAVFFGFYCFFLKLTSVFGANVTIFL